MKGLIILLFYILFFLTCFSGDALMNIMAKHPSFLRNTQLHPTTIFMLASEFGLNILTKSKQVIVDGTFST
jgi:hypothetical protein